MKINIKKVGLFLKSLTEAERLYLDGCFSMSKSIQSLIRKHGLSKVEVCTRFQIKSRKYDDFVTGNYNYDCNDMANLNAAFIDLESEKLKEKVPVQPAAYKYDKPINQKQNGSKPTKKS